MADQIQPFLKSKLIKIYLNPNQTDSIIASQLTNISSIQPDINNSIDEILNLYKYEITSFNGELLNTKKCDLKGARYVIKIEYINHLGIYDIALNLRYLKLVDINTRDSLVQILKQIKNLNPKGIDKIIRCNNKESGEIFKDGFNRYSCLEKFFELDEGFQLSISIIGHGTTTGGTIKFIDALIVEEIIIHLLELDELKEQDFQIVEGEIIKDQLKMSTILFKHQDFKELIKINKSIFFKYNWDHHLNYKNSFDLYLTNSRINFKLFEKSPPSYIDIINNERNYITPTFYRR